MSPRVGLQRGAHPLSPLRRMERPRGQKQEMAVPVKMQTPSETAIYRGPTTVQVQIYLKQLCLF